MLGFRGCRLAIAYPEIAEMQARAIFEAAVEVGRATGGKPVVPEIMVPLIAGKAELDLVKERIDAMAETVAAETKSTGQISGRHHDRTAARGAESRRDRGDRRVLLLRHQRPDPDRPSASAATMPQASSASTRRKAFWRADPFVSIDREGVGELVRIATERGRKVRPKTQARHLRRAWRRSRLGRVLPRGRARLRVLLAVPGADRALGRRAGGAG